MKIKNIFAIVSVCLIVVSGEAMGQGQIKSVVFTGRIVGGKGAQPLAKTYIFIPKAGRGTLADESGFFALPVFPGDSVIFSYLGFQKQFHVIPRRVSDDSYSAIIMLKEDIKTLAEVKVYPYSTEDEFKKAFIDLKLPDEHDREALAKSTNKEYLLQMMAITPMSAASNYSYFMNQQMYGREGYANKNSMTSMSLFNPFAWASFINGVRKGDLKKKEYREILKQAPRENLSRQDFLKKQ
jgi:hypothetical protein